MTIEKGIAKFSLDNDEVNAIHETKRILFNIWNEVDTIYLPDHSYSAREIKEVADFLMEFAENSTFEADLD